MFREKINRIAEAWGMKPIAALLILILVTSGAWGGCTSASYARSEYRNYQEGVASWYGPKFHGRLTANGERYDMDGMRAAHLTFRFGTVVKVTDLDTGRAIIVRINDRGPYVNGRIIDLSREAGRRLGILEKGIAKVRVEVLSSPRRNIYHRDRQRASRR